MKNKRIAALIAVLVAVALAAGVVLVGSVVGHKAEAASVAEREAGVEAFLYASATHYSQGLADAVSEKGVYAEIAGDLVKMCDDGLVSAGVYASGFETREAADILAAWPIACPSKR